MSFKLSSPFLGIPLGASLNGQRSNVGCIFFDRGRPFRRAIRKHVSAERQNDWIAQAIRFSLFCGKNIELFRETIGLRNGFVAKGLKKSFGGSKDLMSSLSTLWKEGLLLVRCSVLVAVLSGVYLLVWYGQKKAKGFVETKLLPSVCSVLSEYIQREIDFGKVRGLSPLSITLEACSIGPHSEEFSCGEVPSMKIRVRPFASLRRGKVVIDAVLSHPSVFIAQKKDYTWLGMPISENGLRKHLSREEGIDYRTKSRRVAREQSATLWARERDYDARKAAEMGYIVSEVSSNRSKDDTVKEIGPSAEMTNSKSHSSMDEKMYRRDHHCVDPGVDCDTKHAELEKSFGVKTPGSGLTLWSKVIKGLKRSHFKKKFNRGDTSSAGVASKRRILKRSASAALTYFQGLSLKDSDDYSGSSGTYDLSVPNTILVKNGDDSSAGNSVDITTAEGSLLSYNQYGEQREKTENQCIKDNGTFGSFNFLHDPFLITVKRLSGFTKVFKNFPYDGNTTGDPKTMGSKVGGEDLFYDVVNRNMDENASEGERSHASPSTFIKSDHTPLAYHSVTFWPLGLKFRLPCIPHSIRKQVSHFLSGSFQKLKFVVVPKVEDIIAEFVGGVDVPQIEGIKRTPPVIVDSVHFNGGTLMLLAFGDREPREIENVSGNVEFKNHYGHVDVQLSGNCKTWRSDLVSEDGGWLSTKVSVNVLDQKWKAKLNISELFVPLLERILEIPITWLKGRATGEVCLSMSRGETFPVLRGELKVTGLAFQIYDSPSCFSDLLASLSFRGQQIFLHNTRGSFGSVPLEASGVFGIHPEEGKFHLMCQVPCVEVNALMKTFKMKPLPFPLAGSVTAVFNCQGPLTAPIFVGSGMVSREISYSVFDVPSSSASEAMLKYKEAGAVAAFDCIPLSYLSANFTFNTDNCVADLYGIRASLVDGGEIRGGGNAWICPEGEEDDTAMDVNFSGNLSIDKIMQRYVPGYVHLMPLKLGDLSGETKLSGSLLKPRFDIKWTAPKAEGSLSDARGDIMISPNCITVNSSSVAFDLFTKVQTSYPEEYWLNRKEFNEKIAVPFIVEGVELDLRMRDFEFFNTVSSYTFDPPRPTHLKATGKIKFHGKVLKPSITSEQGFCPDGQPEKVMDNRSRQSLVGELSVSGLRLNQLMLAPQLIGKLSISRDSIKLDATGRPDESLAVEVVQHSGSEENLQNGKLFSFSLQKGQLKANICLRPLNSATLEIRHLPLDELEIASLRGTIQRAEIQLNFLKRRGHGVLSVLRPKFSGVLGEVLDVAARWSGDVITLEKTVLEQISSRYVLQGEYVLPGSRDSNLSEKGRGGLFKRAMTGHLGSVISSMGRWRMRLDVPRADVAEMLPLARLLSRSTDPAVRFRSKDFFIQSLQSVGVYSESLQDLLEVIHGHYTASDDVVLEDLSLPGLAELKGRWHGSLDASGGGNGDTKANFDFHGKDWEWGSYNTRRVVAVGAYSNDDGLRLEKSFIQLDYATIHVDGTLLGPKTNLDFSVLHFPFSLVPTLKQIIESSATEAVYSLRKWLAPIKGVLHMEGNLRGSLAKPECDVRISLHGGTVGGTELGRAEGVVSLTSSSHFLFNARFEPIIHNGHVHIQGSIPVTFVQNSMSEEEKTETEQSRRALVPGWVKERDKESIDKASEKKTFLERTEEGGNALLAESLKGFNWNILDAGEVRIDADIKDGGMMLLTALSPYADWIDGNANITLQVRGTVEQPVLDGSASFHRASIYSPVLRKPLTNIGGTVNVEANKLCIASLESRVSRKEKLLVKGILPLRTSEASLGDKIDLKCEFLEVRAKNILSGQVDTQLHITGSILQPNISGNIKLSHGEAYLPHDKGSEPAPFIRLASNQSVLPGAGINQAVASTHVSRFFCSEPAFSRTKLAQLSAKSGEVKKEIEQVNIKPSLDVHLSDLRIVLGPELRIVYPLILNFAVSGELELNGLAHPKWIKPKGILTFENGDVNLVATQVRLKREHLNLAKFEPEHGLDPMLDLALVGSEWQFRIQSRASNWQDKLVMTSTHSVEQDVLSSTEAARVFESQLAESILEGDGQLAFKKLATATLETLMPRIEGKGEFGQARWRLVYAPQIPSLLSVDPTSDPLKYLASNISFGTEVEVQLGKRLQASIVRQLKDSEMAMQWTLIYKLTSRLRMLLQSAPSKRLLFEYSATSQD
ncbi:translocon at the inner-envelope membranes of chloroplasts236, EMBRYO DEFECTIVE 2410 [Hibiscus trionum]|uniref:Translocon at the inner-envelope membranes of chloroplasts236, EMBRYO DEFECTIVE 2410 n=1 Tax=Hibiscus trionum TaxID=183268 RepID=A0A9W7JIK6_HIBTR|nr:translocon at the inner-envelope membranes of chloroplasts236, EMBRYO DEFECTIVE 2410 [Hibiscus trionum]